MPRLNWDRIALIAVAGISLIVATSRSVTALPAPASQPVTYSIGGGGVCPSCDLQAARAGTFVVTSNGLIVYCWSTVSFPEAFGSINCSKAHRIKLAPG